MSTTSPEHSTIATNGAKGTNEGSPNGVGTQPETIDGPMSRPPAPDHGSHRRSSHHKRSNSADLAQTFQRQQQMMMMQQQGSNGNLGAGSPNGAYAMYGGAMPPPPPPPHGYYYAYGAPPPQPPHLQQPPHTMAGYSPRMSQSQTLPDYPKPQQLQAPQSGNRARSWSGDPSMFDMDRQQQMQWMMMAGGGAPQPPPPPPSAGAYSFQQPSTPRSRHRRSNSNSSTGGGNNGGNFSPRTEFMKLANVQPSSPRISPRGQQYAYNSSPMPAYSSHLQAPMIGNNPSAAAGGGVGIHPPPQAYEMMYDSFESMGSIGAGNAASFIPRESYGSGGGGGGTGSNNLLSTNSIGSAGGEAVYLAQRARQIPSSSGKAENSSRKRHMRQQSVQLFMQEVKGVEQPPACRDVIWLLIFVFHLFGMVLLSNMYSYDALQEHDDVNGSEVTVYYHNLLIIAGCSGVFAMIVSTTLLGVMAFFARNFLQVALVVAIALSFVWGTLGIGLSPQNLVPVTGIVALALSVAYAIVVWDRLPFSTANLLTALTAIQTYPGTVVMTLVSQFLGLAWSIYYAVICIGVYDAIQEGRIAVSERFAIVIYILLGISYCWTIQVILVRVYIAAKK